MTKLHARILLSAALAAVLCAAALLASPFNNAGTAIADEPAGSDTAVATADGPSSQTDSPADSDAASASQTVAASSNSAASASATPTAATVTVESFSTARIAAVTGSAQADLVREAFPQAKLLLFNTAADASAAVESGKADALCSGSATAKEVITSNPSLAQAQGVLGYSDIAFPFPKTTKGSKLRSQMDALLQELEESGELEAIHRKWEDGTEEERTMPNITLTGENGTLNVCAKGSQPPYCYYKGSQMVGIGPEILLLFCQKYGYTYKLDDMGMDAIMLSLQSAKHDFSIAGVVVTSERAENMSFSRVYDSVEQVLVYKASAVAATGEAQASGVGSIAESFVKTFVREDRWLMLLQGLGTTLVIALCAAALGTLLGYGIALARYRGGRAVNAIFAAYVSIFQGTPVLVMLLIFYYVVFGQVDISGVAVAVLVFSLNSAAFMSENFRTGINAVPPGQTEAALALGYSERRAFYKFVVRQAAPHVLPVYRGEIISLLKGTSVVGYIAVSDLTKVGDIIRSRTYEALFPLLSVAVVYFLLAWLIYKLLTLAEKRLSNKPDKRKRTVKGVVEHD